MGIRDEAELPSERGWRPRRFRRSSRSALGEWVLDSDLAVDSPAEAEAWVDPRRRWEASRPSRRGTIVVHWDFVAPVPTPIAVVPEPEATPEAAPPAEVVAEPAPQPVAEVVAPPRPRPELRPREPNPMWRERVFRGAPAEVQHEAVLWPRRTGP